MFYRKKGYKNERRFVVHDGAKSFQQAKCFLAELIMQMKGNIIAWLCHCKHSAIQKRCAFSLVEMLMALLVASLLLAALAPVMTKRMNDNVSITGISGGTRLDYKRTFYTDSEWTVPNGVNQINITAIGGGGSGGGASYGFKEITASESNWIVPDGVTKLRVFMTGAGGGGASGGSR